MLICTYILTRNDADNIGALEFTARYVDWRLDVEYNNLARRVENVAHGRKKRTPGSLEDVPRTPRVPMKQPEDRIGLLRELDLFLRVLIARGNVRLRRTARNCRRRLGAYASSSNDWIVVAQVHLFPQQLMRWAQSKE